MDYTRPMNTQYASLFPMNKTLQEQNAAVLRTKVVHAFSTILYMTQQLL